jgi:hypothetical protein
LLLRAEKQILYSYMSESYDSITWSNEEKQDPESEGDNSPETSVTRASHHNIVGDGILHSHRRGNLKSYIALSG